MIFIFIALGWMDLKLELSNLNTNDCEFCTPKLAEMIQLQTQRSAYLNVKSSENSNCK